MTGTGAIALLPLIIVAGTSVLVMLAITIRRNHVASLALTLAGLAAAFGSIWIAASIAPRQVTGLIVVDNYSLFMFGLLIGAAAAVAVLSYDYLCKHDLHREELYILLLLATLGAMVLASSSHFASFFLGLEILSVSLYGMIAYPLTARPLEAAIKYLVLAAASAAVLLFGMALVYADLGTMQFGLMARIFQSNSNHDLTVVGLALIITGIGFKLAVVPFHLWTPDIYEGAPAPIAAFIATVSKGAIFALLLRYFYRTGAITNHEITIVFTIVAIASMIVGNLLALMQQNVKRLLAYSSIAHMGYLLVAFLARGEWAVEAVMFYLVAYFVTTLGAFGVVSVLSRRDDEPEQPLDYNGLFWLRPAVAAVFTVMLFSLAGIPVTAGFIGKFFVIAAGTAASTWALVMVLIAGSVVGLFYYLKLAAVMYTLPRPQPMATARHVSAAGGIVLATLTCLLLWFGVYPQPLLRAIQGVFPH